MLPYVDHIVSSARGAEKALSKGRVWFDQEAREAQRLLKQRIPSFLRHGSVANLLTTPVIYSLALPFVLLDVWVTAYQWVCFPVYGIDRVRRGQYFVIDRHRLAYLNAIEKANCMYCSYANGLLAYVREVTARTEQYWCPIRHARPIRAPHRHYQQFFDYGDAAGYRYGLPRMRAALGPDNRRGPIRHAGSDDRRRHRSVLVERAGCARRPSPLGRAGTLVGRG